MIKIGDLYFDLTRTDTFETLNDIVSYCSVPRDKPNKVLATNCPNCGAVVNPSNYKCEYCDTPYSWTTDNRYSREKLLLENELLRCKVEALQQADRTKQLYEEALKAMRQYSQHP